jgi:hypothetical protein
MLYYLILQRFFKVGNLIFWKKNSVKMFIDDTGLLKYYDIIFSRSGVNQTWILTNKLIGFAGDFKWLVSLSIFRRHSPLFTFYFDRLLIHVKWACYIHCEKDLIWFIVFNATFIIISAISWRPVLMVEEAGIPGENHQPWTSNW